MATTRTYTIKIDPADLRYVVVENTCAGKTTTVAKICKCCAVLEGCSEISDCASPKELTLKDPNWQTTPYPSFAKIPINQLHAIGESLVTNLTPANDVCFGIKVLLGAAIPQ